MQNAVKHYFTLNKFFSDIIRSGDRFIGRVYDFEHDRYEDESTEDDSIEEESAEEESVEEESVEGEKCINCAEELSGLAETLIGIREGTKTSFCIHGITRDMWGVNKKPKLAIGEDPNMSWPFNSIDVDQLMSSIHMVEAPYGDILKQETLVNKEVRKAYQCNVENFKFLNGDFEPCVPNFLKDIKLKIGEYLMTNNESLYIVPYRLNVYGVGGFFKAHVDTPKDTEKMIGSIVLYLPSEHTGGELVVTHQGKIHTIDFSQNPGELQWAAFYSDCLHEVKTVTSGYRITMTFNIMTGINQGQYSNITVPVEMGWGNYSGDQTSSVITAGPQMNWCYESLIEKIKMMNSKRIGIILSHEYTLNGLSAKTLKGIDSEIYNRVKKIYKCDLVSAIYDKQHYYISAEFDDCGNCDRDVNDVYIVTDKDWGYYVKHNKLPDTTSDLADKNYKFISFDSIKNVISEHSQASAFTGNETCQGEECYVYFMSALLINKDIRY